MIITGIEPRKKGLSAIYIDGEFAVKLDTKTILENRVKVGADIDDEQLHFLIQQSDLQRAKDKALWLISYRDHSSRELEDKISRTCNREAAKGAVERMEELGLINDENFARRYASQLYENKKLAKSAVIYKLCLKGIDKETASQIAEELEPESDSQIYAVIEKKYKNVLNDEKGRKRAVAGLQRMGYRYGDIKRVLNEFCDEQEFPAEEF